MKKYLKLLFVIMIMTFGLVMAGCSKQITVNLQNYVKLNATGFTGKASFDPEIDINELVSAVEEEIGEKNAMAALRNLRNIDVKTDIPEDLKKNGYYNIKNGEKIKVSFGDINKEAYREQCGLNILADPFELEVTGLEELEKTDIFKGLEIKSEGYDTDGRIWIHRTPDGLYFIDYELEKKDNLSNGENVKVTAKASNGEDLDALLADHGKVAESKEYYYTVSGLESLTDYDPFNGISLKYTGTSGKGYAEIEKDYSLNDNIYTWEYTLDKTEEISNGDVLTVTASYSGYNDDDIIKRGAELGLKVTRTTLEITVEGLPEPLSDVSMIDEEVFDQMKAKDIIRINEFFESGVERSVEADSLKGIEYIGSIIDYVEPTNRHEEYLGLYNIYRCDVKCSFDEPRWVYWYSFYDDVKRKDDGSYNLLDITPSCPADNYSASTFFVSGDIFTTADKKHFYVGFEDMDTLLKYKAKRGQIIFNNVDDSDTEHAKSLSAVVTIVDKDGVTPVSEIDGSAVVKTDVYNYGEYSVSIDKASLVNPLSGLSKFVISVNGYEGAPIDVNKSMVSCIKLICDGKEVDVNEKRVAAEVTDNILNITLFDNEKGVSGKKAAVKSKGFEVTESLEVSFLLEPVATEEEKETSEEKTDTVIEEEVVKTDEVQKTAEEEKAKSEETGKTDEEKKAEEEKAKLEEAGKTDEEQKKTEEEKAELEEAGKTSEENVDKNDNNEKTGDTDKNDNSDGTYTVTLASLGPDRVRMIKTVMDYTGRGLQQAKTLVDDAANSPQVLTTTDDIKFVEELKSVFDMYGAVLDIQ